MLTRRLILPDTLPVGGCLQEQGNGDGNDDRRRNRVRTAGVVMAESAEMGTADDEENEDQRKDRYPQDVSLLVHETATLSLARGRLGRSGFSEVDTGGRALSDPPAQTPHVIAVEIECIPPGGRDPEIAAGLGPRWALTSSTGSMTAPILKR